MLQVKGGIGILSVQDQSKADSVMSEGTHISEMKLDGKPLRDCEMAFECAHGRCRLYIDRRDGGFLGMAVEWVTCSGNNVWTCPDLHVDQMFQVTAYHDGVRHLEFNRGAGDMAGYLYYPNMTGLVALFQKVREIEAEQCPNLDKRW